jgi:hypothetical protein
MAAPRPLGEGGAQRAGSARAGDTGSLAVPVPVQARGLARDRKLLPHLQRDRRRQLSGLAFPLRVREREPGTLDALSALIERL